MTVRDWNVGKCRDSGDRIYWSNTDDTPAEVDIVCPFNWMAKDYFVVVEMAIHGSDMASAEDCALALLQQMNRYGVSEVTQLQIACTYANACFNLATKRGVFGGE